MDDVWICLDALFGERAGERTTEVVKPGSKTYIASQVTLEIASSLFQRHREHHECFYMREGDLVSSFDIARLKNGNRTKYSGPI